MENFAQNLRTRIEELGLTHAEVARRCGLEIRRFHHYVVGDREPDLKTLVRIAQVLDTTPDSLLGLALPPRIGTDEASRLRAKLTATTQLMEAPALRLLTSLVDGVIEFTRGVGALGEKHARTSRASGTTRRK